MVDGCSTCRFTAGKPRGRLRSPYDVCPSVFPNTSCLSVLIGIVAVTEIDLCSEAGSRCSRSSAARGSGRRTPPPAIHALAEIWPGPPCRTADLRFNDAEMINRMSRRLKVFSTADQQLRIVNVRAGAPAPAMQLKTQRTRRSRWWPCPTESQSNGSRSCGRSNGGCRRAGTASRRPRGASRPGAPG